VRPRVRCGIPFRFTSEANSEADDKAVSAVDWMNSRREHVML
jgi:hypothetical protein